MVRRTILSMVSTVLLLLSACPPMEQGARGSATKGDSAAPPPYSRVTTVRGHARFGHDVRAFLPCDTDQPLWVLDSTDALWEPWHALAADAGTAPELFAVVEGSLGPARDAGFGEGYAGTIVVRRVLYVAAEGYGCAAPWESFAFRAFGNEPFWSATVLADSLTLLRPGEPAWTWTGATRRVDVGGVTVRAGDPDAEVAVLRLSAMPCHDSMAGTYFGYRATLHLSGDSLVGCALAGSGP